MTIKLVTLKSGEDVICDLSEVSIPHENGGPGETGGLFYAYLPYVVKLANPQTLYEAVESQEPQISFFPWQPLSRQMTDILIPLGLGCLYN